MKKTLGIAVLTAFTATAAVAAPDVQVITGCTADGKTAHVAAWSEKGANKQDMQNVFENVIKQFSSEQFKSLDKQLVTATKGAFSENGMHGMPVYKNVGPNVPHVTEGCNLKP